ncbi:MAG: VIT domain-containing protein [Anaerolineales bacterium]|nr:VIT domain-containing protein [Anaerolineales bacterium]
MEPIIGGSRLSRTWGEFDAISKHQNELRSLHRLIRRLLQAGLEAAMKIKLFVIPLLLAILLTGAGPAQAEGMIVPDPPDCVSEPCFPPDAPLPMDQLIVRRHHVEVAIENQVAITRVDQVFFNPNDWTIEGMYIFPLPLNTAVTSLTLWIDGEPVEGEILDAEQARRTYEEIVRQMIDPALLEYAGQGAIRVQVFPILPGDERRIALEFSQALPAENGLVRYQYPLNTEKYSAQPIESASITVDIQDNQPLRAVYSPSHPVLVDRLSRHEARVSYEEAHVLPDSDFILYYSLGQSEAFHLLTYRDPGDPADADGFFLVMLAPQPDASTRTVAKDVLLVLDRSGSMEGEKIHQAQEAARYILDRLNPEDRFNIFTFSAGVDSFAPEMVSASEAERAAAWIGRQGAVGGTNINRALLDAVATIEGDRPTYLLFMTDGLPTVDVVEVDQILANLASAAPHNLRLFPFGVGYDVDTVLLDSLAQNHHGLSTYVLPGERLDEKLSQFYERISAPVLTDLALDFGEVTVYDLYPSPLPDLFIGSQIILTGRYREGGHTTVTLSGRVGEQEVAFSYPDQHFGTERQRGASTLSALPRLWATRKIGSLLNQIRLSGPNEEVIDQIVRLSIRYGIVTPYTSYLVTEDMPLGEDEQARIAMEEVEALEMAAEAEPSFGADAVEKAAAQGQMAESASPARLADEAQGTIRIIDSRTFVQQDGVWLDTAFDPGKMETQKVEFLSEAYFALLAARPELRSAFALSDRVVALSEGTAYEVVPLGEQAGSLNFLPILADKSPTEVPPEGGVANPQPQPGPVNTLPCLGGLLPLLILPAGLVLLRRRRV